MAENIAEQNAPELAIQRIYVKDLSFEVPSAPEIFRGEWKPQININMDTKVNKITEDLYEVVLDITVTAKAEEKVAFIAEVKQAGIFMFKNLSSEQFEHTIASFCPSTLYPYAREVISDVVTRGSFPQFVMQPVNFDMLFMQQKQQAAEQEAANK